MLKLVLTVNGRFCRQKSETAAAEKPAKEAQPVQLTKKQAAAAKSAALQARMAAKKAAKQQQAEPGAAAMIAPDADQSSAAAIPEADQKACPVHTAKQEIITISDAEREPDALETTEGVPAAAAVLRDEQNLATAIQTVQEGAADMLAKAQHEAAAQAVREAIWEVADSAASEPRQLG